MLDIGEFKRCVSHTVVGVGSHGQTARDEARPFLEGVSDRNQLSTRLLS